MPKVLIPHSWSHNMGDAAMLITISDILDRIAPGSEVTALVSHPAFTLERCAGINARIEGWPWPIPKGKPSVLELAGYPLVFFGNLLSSALYRLTKRKVFLFNSAYSAPLARFFESDVVISPGGDFIGPDYFFMTTFGEFGMARILGKKLVICAQTIGPFRGMLNGTLASFVLRMADLIIVREERTASDLARLGIRDAQVTSDLAFVFPRPPKAAKRSGRKVILCPKKVGRGRDRYRDSMRKLAERIASLGFEIVLLPSDRYDVAFHREIASGLKAEHVLVEDVHTPEKIAGIISESEFLVSSRMHAIILGALSSTPFVAVGDSFKFREILGPLCDGSTIDLDALDESAIEMIAERIKDRARHRKTIERNMPAVKEKALRNEALLAESFRDWGF